MVKWEWTIHRNVNHFYRYLITLIHYTYSNIYWQKFSNSCIKDLLRVTRKHVMTYWTFVNTTEVGDTLSSTRTGVWLKSLQSVFPLSTHRYLKFDSQWTLFIFIHVVSDLSCELSSQVLLNLQNSILSNPV